MKLGQIGHLFHENRKNKYLEHVKLSPIILSFVCFHRAQTLNSDEADEIMGVRNQSTAAELLLYIELYMVSFIIISLKGISVSYTHLTLPTKRIV